MRNFFKKTLRAILTDSPRGWVNIEGHPHGQPSMIIQKHYEFI